MPQFNEKYSHVVRYTYSLQEIENLLLQHAMGLNSSITADAEVTLQRDDTGITAYVQDDVPRS